jgi:hypothetical protein
LSFGGNTTRRGITVSAGSARILSQSMMRAIQAIENPNLSSDGVLACEEWPATNCDR